MRLKEREYLMNTTQLSCFLEVAEHLSFAKAAQNLHISQPTVSKQIQCSWKMNWVSACLSEARAMFR